MINPAASGQKMSGGCGSQPHPDFLMMAIRALSNPHCSKACTGLGASKPDTLIPSCARMLAIYAGAAQIHQCAEGSCVIASEACIHPG